MLPDVFDDRKKSINITSLADRTIAFRVSVSAQTFYASFVIDDVSIRLSSAVAIAQTKNRRDVMPSDVFKDIRGSV